MNRDEARKLLGENATDEQITNLLNAFHINEKALKDEIATKEKELQQYSDYATIKNQLEEINKSKMTEQEKLEEAKKEIANNLKESRITKNKAKVMTILAGLDIDEELIDSLVGEDENASINKANKLKSKLDSLSDSVAKKTKEELLNLNIEPDMKDANLNTKMDINKFNELSASEQEKFIIDHPDEFEKL